MEQNWTTEEAYQEKYLKYREKAKLYLEQLDLLLYDGSEESLYVLVGLFQKEEFVKTYASSLDELAYLAILANITGKELSLHTAKLFASDFRSAKDFIFHWKEMKFLLWEMEFSCSPGAAGRLYEYMKQREYSPVVWEFLIAVNSVEPERICHALSELFKQRQDAEQLIYMRQLMRDKNDE